MIKHVDLFISSTTACTVHFPDQVVAVWREQSRNTGSCVESRLNIACKVWLIHRFGDFTVRVGL